MNKEMNISLNTTHIHFCIDITNTQDITCKGCSCQSGIYHQLVQKYKEGETVDIYWDADQVLTLFRPQGKYVLPFCNVDRIFNTIDLQLGATWKSASQSALTSWKEPLIPIGSRLGQQSRSGCMD
jgi:hypothetical protein